MISKVKSNIGLQESNSEIKAKQTIKYTQRGKEKYKEGGRERIFQQSSNIVYTIHHILYHSIANSSNLPLVTHA